MSVALPTDKHLTFQCQYRKCTACKACKAGGPGHGPYWYAYCKENGKLKCYYVGKNKPEPAS